MTLKWLIEYLSNKDETKFENIRIYWEKKDILIDFIKEGWISETYIALKSYNFDSRIEIKSIFVVFREENIIKKERLDKDKLLKFNYKEFIENISDKNLKLKEGSGNFDFKNIEKIEIRTKDSEKLYPTEKGINKIMEIIKWEISI